MQAGFGLGLNFSERGEHHTKCTRHDDMYCCLPYSRLSVCVGFCAVEAEILQQYDDGDDDDQANRPAQRKAWSKLKATNQANSSVQPKCQDTVRHIYTTRLFL